MIHVCKVTLLCIMLAMSVTQTSLASQKKTYAMSQKVFKQIEQINLLLDEEEVTKAKALLTALLQKRLSKYENAQVWYMLGAIEYQQSNIPQALEAFSNILKSEGRIPEILYLRTLKTLTQLSLAQSKLENGKQYALKLIDHTRKTPQAENYILLAQVLFRLEDYKGTIDAVTLAQEIMAKANKKTTENILLLQNAAYFEMKNFKDMVATLELLIKYYPKPMYVLYLASVYGQLEQVAKQTVLMESLYENGYLTKAPQLINLASLYLSEKVPYKAAVLLEKSIESELIEYNQGNLEMLSQAWQLAANIQKSILALGKAAKLSDDGELYFRKAYLHYSIGEWKNTEQAVNLALDKGFGNGIGADKKAGEAWLLLGMVLFNVNQFDQAIIACQKALAYQSSKKLAQKWINYIESEQKKFTSLSKAIKD